MRWLGFDWADRMFYASDYFEQMYQFAEQLIRDGKAYVDSLTADEIREYRGTLTEPGRNSPYRDRPVEENLDLFRRMRAGEFADGAHVLRAKIDMASPNINMRDPTLYRIRHADASPHRRRVVHLSDLRLRAPDLRRDRGHHALALHARVRGSSAAVRLGRRARPARRREFRSRPQQIEFARLNLNYTVMSKRKLLALVEQKLVARLGRPAHADHRRHPAPRLHAGGDSRLLRAHRRREEGERHRHRAARAHRPRGSQPPARRARWPCCGR